MQVRWDDKDNRKVSIKRNAGNGEMVKIHFHPAKSIRVWPNEDTTNIETPKNPKRKRYIYHHARNDVCSLPLSLATMHAFRLARGVWKEKRTSGKPQPLPRRKQRALAARKRRLSGILLMWDKQTSMAARSRQHIGPGLINRDGRLPFGPATYGLIKRYGERSIRTPELIEFRGCTTALAPGAACPAPHPSLATTISSLDELPRNIFRIGHRFHIFPFTPEEDSKGFKIEGCSLILHCFANEWILERYYQQQTWKFMKPTYLIIQFFNCISKSERFSLKKKNRENRHHRLWVKEE